MPENRCDEYGVLAPDVLKPSESCCAESGYSRRAICTKLRVQAEEVNKTLFNVRTAQQLLISDINFHPSPRDISNLII